MSLKTLYGLILFLGIWCCIKTYRSSLMEDQISNLSSKLLKVEQNYDVLKREFEEEKERTRRNVR